MLVKYNLLNNPSSFKKIESSHQLETIDDGKTLTVKGKNDWSINFVDESNSGDIEKGKEYYIGYQGTLYGSLAMFYKPGVGYKSINRYRNLIYSKRDYSSNNNPYIFYLKLLSENTELEIKKFFVTDELADIIIDKKSIQSEERQVIYPPEGHYKEIQAL